MAATVRLANGRELTRAEAIDYLELLRERDRRREAKRLETDREAILAKCQTLHGFIEEFWHILEPVAPFKTGWALRAMCDHLEAVTRGDILRLLMTVPPGMMKSLVLVFWTAWEWGPTGKPHLSCLATSYSQPNVFRDNLKLRDLVTSEKFQTLWPLALRADANGVRKFINGKSGFSEARPFSKMTGGRANRVKIDDPHDTENAESPIQRSKTVKIMREAISDRVNDPVTDAIVLIMQRLHEQDCAAVAKELGYVHLELPMEFEPERRCATVLRPANDGNPAIIFEDPRTLPGELLFPERFPATAVAALKKAKGSYAWAGQYQQRPAPRDGGMFKRHWFEVVDAIPANCTSHVRAWDFAGTDEGGDYTVGLKITRDTFSGVFYIEHVVRDQLSPAKVAALVLNTAKADPYGARIRIPQDPAQAGKAQALTYITLLAGYDVVAVPPSGDKATRATPAAIQAEAGSVKLLRGAWNEAFLDEVCVFPAGANDDQVDAFADALNELALGDSFDLGAYVRAYG
jgi:predicted phage terminase large subunit-like protein